MNPDDLRADYLIPMDRENLADIQGYGIPRGELKLLLDFTPEVGIRDMPDPWYTGKFAETYQLIERGCERLLQHIRLKEGLS